MRIGARVLNVSAALLSLVVVAGCDQGELPAVTTPVVDTAIAATVNGRDIFVSDVQLEAEAQGVVKSGEALEPESGEFHSILDQLIDQALLADEAEARGLEDDPASRHRLNAARERILGNILIETLVAQRVDEAAIRKMYETQIAFFELGEEAELRHIVTATRDEIDEVAKQLAAGADFAVLASEKSIDEATRLEGGDLGYFTSSEAPPELKRVIETTPVGGVSKPFQTAQGWHIVKVVDRRQEEPPSLDELRGPILEHLSYLEIEKTLKELRKTASIRRTGGPVNAPLDVDPFELAPVIKPGEADPLADAPPPTQLPAQIDARAPGDVLPQPAPSGADESRAPVSPD
ncbi:peptidylprolyl isomerase [bacterium]|nr:peptidylprolyl isomerase [bacterium]